MKKNLFAANWAQEMTGAKWGLISFSLYFSTQGFRPEIRLSTN